MDIKKSVPLITQIIKGTKFGTPQTGGYSSQYNTSENSFQAEKFTSEESKPPVNNMGVVNTSLGLKALIDWFTCTLPDDDVEVAFKVLRMPRESFIKMERGLSWYAEQWRCGNIVVLTKGLSSGMGCHVSMTGQGCRAYEARFGDVWVDLIKRVKAANGHFTRLDNAIDDRKGYFTVDQVRSKVKSGEVKTVFKQARGIEQYSLKRETGITGNTVYFGSPKSSLQVRIYDKAKEQGQDGVVWNRIEIEARDERADELASKISEGKPLGEIVLGVLSRYLNFIEPSSDTNKSRWLLCEWWSSFLCDVQKIRLTIERAVRTVVQVATWLDRQAASSLAIVKKVYGAGYIKQLLYSGEERFKERHLTMLAGVSHG